ncbi:hypothetical protein QBZ16_004009 [Prototheca wickerhamii]|uniref:RRM domain-containing protein n=1 Tax=Prototheca wickerhamii TaxID=3111 RepID=A0AAD9IGS4_PROWI|nr:hypothetical protein QBZ16_004009 [Prototheca wickerhamii]
MRGGSPRRYPDGSPRRSRRAPSPAYRRRRRSATPPEARLQRQREREIEKMDRDMRTVFGYNLPLRAEEPDLFAFFVRAGPLVDIKIIRDRATGRSKGVAYVEYQRKEDVMGALALSGQALQGQAVMVKMSEAEKNLAWEAAEAQKAQARELEARGLAPDALTAAPALPALGLDLSDPAGAAAAVAAAAGFGAGAAPAAGRVSIDNLHPAVAEADLRPIFEPFGLVDGVVVQRDAATGQGTGRAWVSYRQLADAARARAQPRRLCARRPRAARGHRRRRAAAGRGRAARGRGRRCAAAAAAAAVAAGAAGHQRRRRRRRHAPDGRRARRADERARRGRGHGGARAEPARPGAPRAPLAPDAAVPEAVRLEQGLLGPASPIPTQCVLLKNMFDPAEETEPGWAEDIGADVRDECTKFGDVLHAHVDANSKVRCGLWCGWVVGGGGTGGRKVEAWGNRVQANQRNTPLPSPQLLK